MCAQALSRGDLTGRNSPHGVINKIGHHVHQVSEEGMMPGR